MYFISSPTWRTTWRMAGRNSSKGKDQGISSGLLRQEIRERHHRQDPTDRESLQKEGISIQAKFEL